MIGLRPGDFRFPPIRELEHRGNVEYPSFLTKLPESCVTLSRSYGRGGAQAEGLGGEGLYTGLSKTLTSHRFAVGPSSPAKSGRGAGELER